MRPLCRPLDRVDVARLELKVCGVTSAQELHMLDRLGVDYAGLWFQVPSGRHELDPDRFFALAHTPRRALRCVGVTTERDPEAIVGWVERSGVAAVQLHGFQMPATVSWLKRRLRAEVEVWKVLHAQQGRCLEGALLPVYAACGADAFILDSFVSREQPGSTGKRVPLEAVVEVAEAVGGAKLFLAGGMDAAAIRTVGPLVRLRGVDIDTAAREQCCLHPGRVASLVQAVRGGDFA